MKSSAERHNDFIAYRAYCEEFLSHKRRNRFLARWTSTKLVSCGCGCGESWADDLSDTNWLSQILSLKSFFVMIYHLHLATKAIHGVVWSAVPVFWTFATCSSRNISMLSDPAKGLSKPLALFLRICCLILAVFCWILSRLGGPIFVAFFLVALAVTWITLSFALVLNAAMLLPFATSLIVGLAAGYFMQDQWWIAALCIGIGTVFQYLQHRRGERKRQAELGHVLAIATGAMMPNPDKPIRMKTHAEILEERSLASAAEPVYEDDVQAWLHLVKARPATPPGVHKYSDTLIGTARYVTDHEIYWERCDEARIAAKTQTISTVRFAINKFADEWALPSDRISKLRSRAKLLTIDDTHYGGQRRPLYPDGWVESDPDDQLARLRQLSELLERWEH